MIQPINIFIGFDPKETVAYHVLAHSIMTRSSVPVRITPVMQSQLRHEGYYWRERNPLESTEFSLTRFLVPFLSSFTGYSIFMDCDMLMLDDIATLMYEVVPGWDVPYGNDSACEVWVCQHEYTPGTTTKMDNQVQTNYPCKNWSSFMIFNNQRCHALHLEYVNSATPLALHRFSWARRVGDIDLRWNYLVGEYEAATADLHPEEIANFHWTLGGPWMTGYEDAPYAQIWKTEYARMVEPMPCPSMR